MAALKAISYAEPDIKSSYQTSRKIRDWINPPRGTQGLYSVWDDDVVLEGHSIPIRILNPRYNLETKEFFFSMGEDGFSGILITIQEPVP